MSLQTETEAAVLAVCLKNPQAYGDTIGVITSSMFSESKHRALFKAIEAVYNRGKEINILTVRDEIAAHSGQYKGVDDLFITQTSDHEAAYGSLVVNSYANVLVNQVKGRTKKQIIETMMTEEDDDKIAEQANRLLDMQKAGEQEIVSMDQAVMKSLSIIKERKTARDENRNKYPTSGISLLDQNLGGFKPGRLYMLGARTSMGKCLGVGIKVVMADGNFCSVENIKCGDKLMGVDSKPKRVLSTVCGKGMMYWVRQIRGIDYRVNENHVLSFKKSNNEGKHRHGDILNMSVLEAKNKGVGFWCRHKGYKVGIDFPEQDIPVDPYLLGLWLGDGNSYRSTIYTADKEISDWIYEYAEGRGDTVTIENVKGNHKCKPYHINAKRGKSSREAGEEIGVSYSTILNWRKLGKYPLKIQNDSLQTELKRMGLMGNGNKHIPKRYLINSKENRLQLLAGLIDSDGYYGGSYEITQKNERLINDIKRLCDSLGYGTSIREKMATIKDRNFKGKVFRLIFNGNVSEIPVKVKRKKACDCSRDASMNAIYLEKDKVDNYYGFTLEGDGLFLLEDMTVTHNSDLMTNWSYNMSKRFKVGIISPEMSLTYLMDRFWNLHTDVDRFNIGTGNLTDLDMQELYHKADLGERPIVFNCKSSPKIAYVRSCLNTMIKRHHVDILFIDHLHELQPPSGNTTDVNKWREATKRIRDMARDFNLPIILLAQLSRQSERDRNRKPKLMDLREAGEEVSDVVLMLWRKGYQNYDLTKDQLAILIRKNRDGILKSIWCDYFLKSGKITQCEEQKDLSKEKTEEDTEDDLPF